MNATIFSCYSSSSMFKYLILCFCSSSFSQQFLLHLLSHHVIFSAPPFPLLLQNVFLYSFMFSPSALLFLCVVFSTFPPVCFIIISCLLLLLLPLGDEVAGGSVTLFICVVAVNLLSNSHFVCRRQKRRKDTVESL